MKALTVAPDWGMMYFLGDKTIEFRTWNTNYRGTIVICTSAKKIRGCISGHALMIADIVDCVPFRKEHLEAAAMDSMPNESGFAWILDNFHMIHPVPVKGRLGLFDLDIEIEQIPDDLPEDEAEKYINDVFIPIIFRPVLK